MKILVIGDFHGKFPNKFLRIIKKESIDVIISPGDFSSMEKIRKFIFKYWTSKKWWEVVGLKRAKQIEKEAFDSGLKLLKKLNSLDKKVYVIWGNSDFYKDLLSKEEKPINPGYFEDKIKGFKNIILVDKKKTKIDGIDIIGFGGYVDASEYIKNPIDKDIKKRKQRLKRYLRDAKRLNSLFLRAKPNKNFIFLIHFTPYKIFDKVKYKESPMYGKHVGWEPYNKAIKRFKPRLVICGHMHEYQGQKTLGKSIIVNPGPAYEGKAAVIEFDEKRGRVKKIKFIN